MVQTNCVMCDSMFDTELVQEQHGEYLPARNYCEVCDYGSHKCIELHIMVRDGYESEVSVLVADGLRELVQEVEGLRFLHAEVRSDDV